MALELPPTLLVFADDWGRHPSSCQHLVKRLLSDSQVVWVNTIGSRAPALDMATVRRGVEKLRGWFSPGEATPPSSPVSEEHATGELAPKVISPIMWPSFRGAARRRLNRTLLTRAINRALEETARPRVAITTLPLVADLIGHVDVDAWLYYCVDDLAAWPGLDAAPLQAMEVDLLRKADAVVAVSEHLQTRLQGLGRASTLISHGVDLEHWHFEQQPAASGRASPAAQLATEPSIVFWGLIDQRLEVEWVLALANAIVSSANQESEAPRPITITLAGPIETLPDSLAKHPHVATPGAVAFDDLPRLAASAGVLIMPYRDLPATRAMQPLKMKEYLATGRPCVVRRLPATEPWADCLDVVETADEFVATTLARLTEGIPTEQVAARQRLSDESWDAKATDLRQVLGQLADMGRQSSMEVANA